MFDGIRKDVQLDEAGIVRWGSGPTGLMSNVKYKSGSVQIKEWYRQICISEKSLYHMTEVQTGIKETNWDLLQ